MYRFTLFLLLALFSPCAWAQLSLLTDSTLRVDLTFSAQGKNAQISLTELHLLEGWYGRRHHLDSLPLKGTGQITLYDKETGQKLYAQGFCTSFQEWLATQEAEHTPRAFEQVFLLPFPRREAVVEIKLQDVKQCPIASSRILVNPQDILIRRHPERSPYRTEYIHRGGATKECINVAIPAEGYREEEMPEFLERARQGVKAILSYEPFKSFASHFNFIAVQTPSKDSGVSVPRKGIWRDTAFGSHFDTFYSERYLTTSQIKKLHNSLVNIPYEHILVLANTSTYGGAGFFNSNMLVAANNKYFEPVTVHEFGHSFGGLADEYFYDQDLMTDTYSKAIEPWEQNVTNLVDFMGKKWSKLILKGIPIPTPNKLSQKVLVGLYEGGVYNKNGFYRCSFDCRMRSNKYPTFCPACRLALSNLIRFYVE